MIQASDGLRERSATPRRHISDGPLITIITVCLNSERFLEQTIKSVISQTYKNIEYVIIDGGSTDKTIDIIKEYEDYIWLWVSEPDGGIFDAMNKGIDFSRGEWVGIINSDDWYNAKAVEWVVSALREQPNVQIFHGNVIVVNKDNPYRLKLGSEDYFSEKKQLCVHHPTCFVRQDVYDLYKFNPKFLLSADREFILKLIANDVVFGYLNLPMVYFRNTGASNEPSFRSVLDRYNIRKKYYHLSNARRFYVEDILSYLDELVYFYIKKLRKRFK